MNNGPTFGCVYPDCMKRVWNEDEACEEHTILQQFIEEEFRRVMKRI